MNKTLNKGLSVLILSAMLFTLPGMSVLAEVMVQDDDEIIWDEDGEDDFLTATVGNATRSIATPSNVILSGTNLREGEVFEVLVGQHEMQFMVLEFGKTVQIGNGIQPAISEDSVGELYIPEAVEYGETTYEVVRIGSYAFIGCQYLIGSLNIPSRITSIGEYAFAYCSGFNGSLSLPSGIASIDGLTFKGCSGFTGTLEIPAGVTSIGGSAFEDCSGFTGTLEIPSGVTRIYGWAFAGCNGFTGMLTIPSGVTEIYTATFMGCSGLTGTVSIPVGVDYIVPSAFDDCDNITAFEVERGNEYFSSIDGILFDKAQTTLVRCPGGKQGKLVIPDGVTIIGDGAFHNCKYLTGKLTIPSSITTISDGAFYGCSGFTGTLNIPDSVTQIGSYAFYDCSGFTGELILPPDLSWIPYYTFYGCSGLSGGIVIYPELHSIAFCAFEGCSNLEYVQFVGNCAMNLGWYGSYRAFDDCSPGFVLYYPKGDSTWNDFVYNGDSIINICAYGPDDHFITVRNGVPSALAAEKGTVITVTANTAPSGQRFSRWETSLNINFTNGTNRASATATFIMPEENVMLTAVYIKDGEQSSSGDSSVVSFVGNTGTWIQDEYGWWYQYNNNSWPKNGWAQLEYNNKNDWYYFDENGYMKTGWVLWNGRQYYLNPVSDGTQGRMVTGWLFIDSKWCYFNEVSDGVLGAFVQDTDNIPGSI